MKFTIIAFLSLIFIGFSEVNGQELSKNKFENAISNHVMVRLYEGQSPSSILSEVPSDFELKIDHELSKKGNIWLFTFNDQNVNLKEVLNQVKRVSSVQFAQPNRKVTLRAAPNDPDYGSQWQHDNIDSELAWDITTGGQTPGGTDIVVALIESADLINHDDLKDNQWVNTAETPNNGIDDDNNGYVDDYNGWNVSSNDDAIGAGTHGTSCAGMIGAKGDNNLGVAGANWDIKIMDIAGYSNPFTEANIVEAYSYALDARIKWNQTNGAEGAFVVATSASWGIDGGNASDYPIWCSFYDDLGQAGILNVGATTNNNDDVDVVGDVPTTCASDYMVGVTATDQSDIIDFAGYGDQTINLAAPGSNIYTTAPNNGYTTTSGTSFACPLTAGVIGLMYSVPCANIEAMALNNPQGTADIVRQALYYGVDQTPYLQERTISGGRINARNSIDRLMDQACSSCGFPSNISSDNIMENSATINFDNVTDANSYTIYYREQGTSTWLDDASSTNSFPLSGLTACTTYEYYLKADCGDELSGQTFTSTFKTDGCGNCVDLTYCSTVVDNPNEELHVESPSSISGSYSYTPSSNFGGDPSNGYVYGNLVLVDDGTASPEEGCNTLTNGTAISGNIAVARRGSCNFTDKAMNAQNEGATAIIIVNNVPGAPIDMGGTNNNVSIPAIMISQTDGNALINAIENGDEPVALLGNQNEWIESFEFDGNVSSTGDNNGYLAPENSPYSLSIGGTYSFSLTPGFDGQGMPEYTRIWLDSDQDGSFDASEVIYDQGTASSVALTDNVTIPSSAMLGSSRIRVQMAYQSANTTLPNACGNFTSGEVEDYCVQLSKFNGLTEAELNDVTIYPNPNNGVFKITSNKSQNQVIEIYSSLGKKISTIQLMQKTTTVNSQNWNPGIYFVRIMNKDGKLLETKKLSIIK